MKFSKTKTCGSCGATFECGGLLLCWCREVTLDRAALDRLREQYDDCLCRSCLEAAAARAKQGAPLTLIK